MNTVSIGQMGASTGKELAAKVQDYITNLSTSKSKEVNVTDAVRSLTERKKAMETTQEQKIMKELQQQIDEGTKIEEQREQLYHQREKLQLQEQQIEIKKRTLFSNQDEACNQYHEQLSAIRQKYQFYQELSEQEHSLEQLMQEQTRKIEGNAIESEEIEQLKKDIHEIERKHQRSIELSHKVMHCQQEGKHQRQARKNGIWESVWPSLYRNHSSDFATPRGIGEKFHFPFYDPCGRHQLFDTSGKPSGQKFGFHWDIRRKSQAIFA